MFQIVRYFGLAVLILGCLVLMPPAGSSGAQEKKTVPVPSSPKPVPPKAMPGVHRVKREPFSVKVELPGVFESREMVEISVRPRTWAQLRVMDMVKAGTIVGKGDRLVAFDTDQIDDVIHGLVSQRELSGLKIQQKEEELGALERSLSLDLAVARRLQEQADQLLLRFLKVDRPESEKQALFNVKSAEDRLAYELEELDQLEKMYRADDLTEETEEIVLKRQQDTVERYKYYEEKAKVDGQRVVELDLPLREQLLKEGARRQTLAWEKSQKILPLQVSKEQLELEKLRFEREKTEDRLAKLNQDRAQLIVRSPVEGVVYYGRCVRGRFSEAGTLATRLRPGGVLQSHEVFMTIVKPRPVFIRVTIPEKELHRLSPQSRGSAVPTGYPGQRLPTALEWVSSIPATPGTFEGTFSVEIGEDAPVLKPGMGCKVHLVPYRKNDALTVPVGALFTDELSDEKRYVYLRIPGGNTRRYVTVGERTLKKVEVLEGLKEGEEIFLSRQD